MHNAQCTMHNAQCTMSWYRASVVQIRAMNVHKFIAHRPVAHCTTATAHCTTATFQATAGFTLVDSTPLRLSTRNSDRRETDSVLM